MGESKMNPLLTVLTSVNLFRQTVVSKFRNLELTQQQRIVMAGRFNQFESLLDVCLSLLVDIVSEHVLVVPPAGERRGGGDVLNPVELAISKANWFRQTMQGHLQNLSLTLFEEAALKANLEAVDVVLSGCLSDVNHFVISVLECCPDDKTQAAPQPMSGEGGRGPTMD